MTHFEISRFLKLLFFALILLQLFPLDLEASTGGVEMRVPAAINHQAVMQIQPTHLAGTDSAGASISAELIANYKQMKASEKPIDTSLLIPTDMSPSDDSSQVFSKVADKSATHFFNSPEIRGTAFGRTATSVENSLKKEVVFSQSNSTQHSFKFNFQAFQTLAEVQYKGFTNAALKYKANESKVALEIFEKIMGGKDVVLSHVMSPRDRLSQLSLRWNF